MRIIIPYLILCLGVICNAELRTWTAVNGKKVEAEFVSNSDGQVSLKMKSGKVFEVSLNKLSKADQEFIKAKSSPKEPTKEEAPVNPNLKYEVKDSAVTITGCDKKVSGALTIPATIEGKPVTSIGKSAFDKCTNLTSITIPDSVTSIGDLAFGLCKSLTTIEIGARNVNFTEVNGVLFNAEKTVLLTYPASKEGANYTIPDSVTSIKTGAFSGCTSLTSITMGESVTSIGEVAFYGCSSLTSITIPDGVTSIGPEAFMRCTSLTSITIPDSVTSIGDFAFGLCSGLTSITIGNGLTSIRERTFLQCTSLTSITIPDSVTSIGPEAFKECSGLTSITIPDGVTSIGENAFRDCSSLTSITIPDSVTSIGDFAFWLCTSLTAVTFLGDAPTVGEGVFAGATHTFYRKPEAKGWGDTFGGRPVKLISEKP